ncbi:MAG TPA: glycosyltransferase family 2 protein [Candidatus Acidoferrales bacterium]|nr:glycosyltransferase family 2 protein [Candidatus Acidoferrales bacterium]
MINSLFIILVNFGEADQTIDCVKSLRKSSLTDFNVIIIDNGGTSDSRKILQQACHGVVVLSTEQNLGFGGANNMGIDYALQNGADLILLLNNDTIVKEDTIEKLVETAKQEPEAGIIGAKIHYYDKPNTLWYAGGRLDIDRGLGTHIGIGKEDDGLQQHCVETDFVTGCCMLIKREVIEKIGKLDHSYFLYLEDADYSVRAKRAGYSVLYQPAAVLYHRVSSSIRWDSPTYVYFNLRNKILFLRKNGNPRKWLFNLQYFIYFYGRQFVRLILKHKNYRAARAAFLGLRDGLINYTGSNGEGSLYKL